ncbi:arylesterase [Aurantiacibacter spongiae]|uniref:Arylesterase n=1 Tax=Aurantiacibacter spongiae TaxID=2488860 RepID=A0A3N5CTS1_9SPHN|nr:arylesterase [Aurantiacibacter spongiae]RPF72097.1 arylesterase [Aurantiacibacter spongiae]
MSKVAKLAVALLPVAILTGCDGDAPAATQAAGTAAPTAPAEPMPVMGDPVTILAFGDSLFAGYNLGEEEGYPEVLERTLRARGINARVIDAGVSGDTTAAGRQRIGFVLDNAPARPDLALVELGGNDLLRGIDPARTRANLEGILQQLQQREIPVVLMGMRAPPNLGAQYQQDFDGLYTELARQYDTGLVPFFMEPMANDARLIQQDRVHPTAEGVEELVRNSLGEVVDALPDGEPAS